MFDVLSHICSYIFELYIFFQCQFPETSTRSDNKNMFLHNHLVWHISCQYAVFVSVFFIFMSLVNGLPAVSFVPELKYQYFIMMNWISFRILHHFCLRCFMKFAVEKKSNEYVRVYSKCILKHFLAWNSQQMSNLIKRYKEIKTNWSTKVRDVMKWNGLRNKNKIDKVIRRKEIYFSMK